MYNYLGLVNDVNKRLNEVELTESNFLSAQGFHSMAKDSVNAAIRHINRSAFEWPFNHVTQEETLIPGSVRYFYPYDVKTVDFDSFRVKRSSTYNNETYRLKLLSYEDYLDKYVDSEYNTDSSIRGVPRYVFRTPSQEYGVYPPPDQPYEIVYEYYRLPVDLINPTDSPSLPEQFRYVIIEGAMHFAYFFRGNTQDATLHFQKFEEGIKDMRSLYINRYEYIRDTRVSNSFVTNPRVS
jgi:hypothetical protein